MTQVLRLDRVSRILTNEVVPVPLVNGVSCAIQRGEFVAITGSSGSGKSSMLYLMGLLDRPTSGGIVIDGQEMSRAAESEREQARLEKIGFVFQFHFLLQEFSALDNILLPMRKLGRLSEPEMQARADRLLDLLHMRGGARKMPHQLSGGERQRIAIARALANNPLVVLADEPTGNLDSKNAAAVIDMFKSIAKEQGVAVVAVTHDLGIAAQADRRITMQDGKILPDL